MIMNLKAIRCLPLVFLLASGGECVCNPVEEEYHPILCRAVQFAEHDPEAVASTIHDWAHAHGLLVDLRSGAKSLRGYDTVSTEMARIERGRRQLTGAKGSQLPVVFAHGMGDSCFNDGMQHITAHASEILGGVYTVCVPTGASQAEDTKNGYFLSMDANVDIFADAIQRDDRLRNGFHAIGFSQGNNVIRGYIARYNDPPVHTFLSVNGVNAGIGAVPHCRPGALASSSLSWCELLMEQASHRAYTAFAQEHSFQANYWRDPRPSMTPLYHQYSQLARWNNEAAFNQTLKDNFAKTQAFVWILATADSMVWPKEGEQWGAPDPMDPFHTILPKEKTDWYQNDLFGLRTAEEAGKNFFEQFDGDHLQFSLVDFERWVSTYLLSTTQ